MPVLRGLLHISHEPGFLGWRESLLITVSVQLATAPLVISQFQSFSLTSFIASVLVVWMLPFILASGLLLAFVSFVSRLLSFLLSVIVAPMMEYVLLIVNVFAKAAVLFNPTLGFVGIALYYSGLMALMYWYYAPGRIPSVI